MKRLCLLISIILLFICSCDIKKEARYVIGVSQCSDDLWRETVNNEMLREASFYQGTQIEIRTVKDDTQQQIKDIETFIDSKVDLLIVAPNESTAITPVVQRAVDNGIPVILLDRKIDTDDYTAYVGGDNYQIGYDAGLYIANILKGEGSVVEIRGWEGSTADTERHVGFREAIKNYEGIDVVAERRGNFLEEVAQRQMADILKEKDNIDVVFALNDPMAIGVHNATMKGSGKRPFIIGIDALPGKGGGIQNILDGLQDASFIYPTGGDKVIQLAMDILEGRPYKKENILYTAVVDKSNARVIQLQTEQIFEHQSKLETMNNMLNQSIIQYSNQQALFYATIAVSVLILILLVMVILAYRNKAKTNAQLERQNKEIKEQAETLEQQKEQLISLSRQLEEATNAKLVFFTNISHEFRTPLTLILGPVENLLNSENLSAEQKELLDLIERNSNILSELISQVIGFRSYENGKMRVYLSKDNLKEFIQELNIIFIDYAKRKQVDFSFESDASPFEMWYDKEKIEKIYFNLLSNAFKHTEQQGQINVSLHKVEIDNEPYAKLTIHNTGKPIPKDKINSIFNRFYKVNPHDAGTGIGLALTSALIEVHQGKISVDSGEGIGTTFSVLLPFKCTDGLVTEENVYERGYTENMVASTFAHQADNSILKTANETDKPIILLIEDNIDMRNYMCQILQNDYAVINASNGEEGIDKAIKYIPDVVISDIMMPDKDGFEVCYTLKENVSTCHIPVILLTACSLDEQKAIGFEKGADAYIPKPFNAELLKIRIKKLIENRQKIKEAFGNSLLNDSRKVIQGEVEDTFIANLRKYIESHISDSELNINDIAQNMNLSKSQLYRKVKSTTNYSPNELVRIIRLKSARDLLGQQGKTISEIAYETGFSSLSYFTKCFKELFNENPSEYVNRTNK